VRSLRGQVRAGNGLLIDYPHSVLTEVFDPCKVQAEMPKVDFVSVGVFNINRPTMRMWYFRYLSDMRRFVELIEGEGRAIAPDGLERVYWHHADTSRIQTYREDPRSRDPRHAGADRRLDERYAHSASYAGAVGD
jgi:hypothetical protein